MLIYWVVVISLFEKKKRNIFVIIVNQLNCINSAFSPYYRHLWRWSSLAKRQKRDRVSNCPYISSNSPPSRIPCKLYYKNFEIKYRPQVLFIIVWDFNRYIDRYIDIFEICNLVCFYCFYIGKKKWCKINGISGILPLPILCAFVDKAR